MNALLGIELTRDEIIGYLGRVGFVVEGDEVVVPFYRTDIARMCDLAEEVARMYGYDKIPTTQFGGSAAGGLTPEQTFEKNVGALARSCGFDEALTLSFGSSKMYDSIRLPEDSEKRISVKILNPLGEDLSIMRTTSLPSLLECLMHNFNHRNATASLYELAAIYQPVIKDGAADPDALPKEPRILTMGTYGRLSFFQFKGVVERILHESGVQDVSFEPVNDNPSYHPGRCARILSGETEIGVFGTIHPLVAKAYGAGNTEIIAAEIAIDGMYANSSAVKLYQPLPKYPASTRDIAVLCDENIPVAHMEKVIAKAVGGILESVSLFDVY
jgi:phenylalanyl-tRNA synthetase beta chain